jgi:hydrogenase maturation protease
VIGYGNPSRQDDGVGLAVVNGLRRCSGVRPLDEGEDGFDDLGRPLDTLFLQQLSPELTELLRDYDHLCVVDAHFGIYEELVHVTDLEPQESAAIVSHHFKPGALLALVRDLYGATLTGELISVRGFSFDFSPELTPLTAEGVAQVVDDLWSRFGGDSSAPVG